MNPIFGKPAGGSGDIGPAALIQRLMGNPSWKRPPKGHTTACQAKSSIRTIHALLRGKNTCAGGKGKWA